MTPAAVRARLRAIRDHVDDFEAAHGLEDDLRADVLKAIADGTCAEPAECAREALKTKNVAFKRVCA